MLDMRTYRFTITVEADTAQEAIDALEDLIAQEGLGAGEVEIIEDES